MGNGQNWQQQGGYGRPPASPPGYGPPPPPQQWQAPRPPSGRGRKTGIAVVAVVVLIGLAVGGVFLKNSLTDNDGSRTSDYQLTLPVTTGDFRIAKPAQPVTDFDQDRLAKVGLSNPKGTTATYYAGISPEEAANLDPSQLGDREVTTMGVFGAWGEVADPEKAVDALFAYGVEQGRETSGIDLALVGKPEPQQPSGIGDATMKCQHAEVTGITIAVCVWADEHTLGFVTLQRQNARGPVDLPLHVAADHTSALRTASLVFTSSTPAG
jgi:hypothetical protein